MYNGVSFGDYLQLTIMFLLLLYCVFANLDIGLMREVIFLRYLVLLQVFSYYVNIRELRDLRDKVERRDG